MNLTDLPDTKAKADMANTVATALDRTPVFAADAVRQDRSRFFNPTAVDWEVRGINALLPRRHCSIGPEAPRGGGASP